MDFKLIFSIFKEISQIAISLVTSFIPCNFFLNMFITGFNILNSTCRQTDIPPTKICDSKVAMLLVETSMFVGCEFMAYKRYVEGKWEDQDSSLEAGVKVLAIVTPPAVKTLLCLYNSLKQTQVPVDTDINRLEVPVIDNTPQTIRPLY